METKKAQLVTLTTKGWLTARIESNDFDEAMEIICPDTTQAQLCIPYTRLLCTDAYLRSSNDLSKLVEKEQELATNLGVPFYAIDAAVNLEGKKIKLQSRIYTPNIRGFSGLPFSNLFNESKSIEYLYLCKHFIYLDNTDAKNH